MREQKVMALEVEQRKATAHAKHPVFGHWHRMIFRPMLLGTCLERTIPYFMNGSPLNCFCSALNWVLNLPRSPDRPVMASLVSAEGSSLALL